MRDATTLESLTAILPIRTSLGTSNDLLCVEFYFLMVIGVPRIPA